MPKVYIVGGPEGGYGLMFKNAGWELAPHLLDADMVQFTGGEDVTPYLYGEDPHRTTYSSARRDYEEAGYFAIAQRLGKPMSGICRGGQFLNVMSGGSMYQHVNKHATGERHILRDTVTLKELSVSSTHHQMMRKGPGGELIAVAFEGGFKQSMEDGKVVNSDGGEADTEVVYYKDTKSLCFQPHPEFFRPGDECFEYYFELIERCHGLRA